ncbi:MAG TPA: hypothetical protein VGB64_13580 [Actinomycetota bacterium]|jgi:hypothetical protein
MILALNLLFAATVSAVMLLQVSKLGREPTRKHRMAQAILLVLTVAVWVTVIVKPASEEWFELYASLLPLALLAYLIRKMGERSRP